MTAARWRPPTPRAPADDELEVERAVAAAATVRDRREHEAVCEAQAAIARLEATT